MDWEIELDRGLIRHYSDSETSEADTNFYLTKPTLKNIIPVCPAMISVGITHNKVSSLCPSLFLELSMVE